MQHLVGGRVIDGIADEPLDGGVVSFADGHIQFVGPKSEARISRDDEVTDVAGATVLPGLIDCHVHHIYARYRNLAEGERVPLETSTLKGVVHTGFYLKAGFTTVRDCGTRGNVAVALRDAVNEGLIPGPRIVASGQILSTTGGLADANPDWMSNCYGLGRVVNGVDEVRKVVRQQVKAGVDNIKIEGSAAEASFYTYTWMSTMALDEMTAAVREAHRYGKTVACHAQSLQGAKNALRAGTDTIEHGTRLDEEAIELFRSGKTVLVPTLSTLFSVLELGEKFGVPAKMVDEMRINEPLWLNSLAMAKAAGVTIAAGADIGNRYPQGDNAKEIVLLAQRGGLTPMEALRAGTANGAKALRRSDSVGSLRPGLFADILVFDGDPLQDISSLLERDRVRMVFKGGVLAAGSALGRPN
jgi:imidazolonepropionase-like amidohydrolase